MTEQLYLRNGRWITLRQVNELENPSKTVSEPQKIDACATQFSQVPTTQEPVIEDKKEPVIQDPVIKEPTLDELKKMCDDRGIKYHHASKEKKLKALLGL